MKRAETASPGDAERDGSRRAVSPAAERSAQLEGVAAQDGA